ncbi:MAG: hypothetical protein IJQ23_04890 [Clostridia bacterium]|nr:hypothetical protein [Clostridia bacterium]
MKKSDFIDVMQNITEKTFYIFIFSFILPSGTLLNIPIKLILCGIILFSMVFYLDKIKLDKIYFCLIIIVASLFLWATIAFGNGFSETVIQCLKMFFSLLIVIWLAWVLLQNKIIDEKKAYYYLMIAVFAIIVFKFLIEIILLTHLMEMGRFIALFRQLFNCDIMSLYFNVGKLFLYRAMMPNDSIPFLYYSFIVFTRGKPMNKVGFTFIIALYCLITYSRVYIAQFVLTLLLFALLSVSKLKASGFFRSKYFHVFCIALISVIIIFVFYVADTSLYRRFFGSDAQYSDSFRTEQAEFLYSGFTLQPLIGYGLGAYMTDYIRSDALKFSYELEYLSFLYQFGILGFLLIIVPILVLAHFICLKYIKDKKLKVIIIFNLAFWAISPLFNPSFLSSNSGVIVGMLCILGRYFQGKSQSGLPHNFALGNVKFVGAL